MRPAHPVERAFGIEQYVSDLDGVGGRLRDRPEDFHVRELEAFDVEPVDADPGAYPHLVFRATLRNRDTNDFASELSDRLGISRERITWSGTKDKRAVTTQLFAIKSYDCDDLPAVSGADTQVVGRAGRPVLFGDHRGNAFEIVVRDPDHTDVAPITRDLRAFRHPDGGVDPGAEGADGASTEGADGASADEDPDRVGTTPIGVPNWFGQQRFGTRRPVTHEVGLAVVRGDWEGAVLSYVGNPSDREPEETREARAYVDETRDWQGALDRLPRHLGYERSICHRLVENGGDGPEDFRDALEAVPSNLQTLFVNAAQSFLFNRMLSERLDRGLPFHRPVHGDVVCFADEDGLPDPDREQRVDADRVDVVARHCDRGRAFVTAPLVGTDTALGDGEPGDIERRVLADVGVEPADFDLPGDFGSTGTRRAVLLSAGIDVTTDPLTFAFELPSGAYATVVLREYLKADPDDMA